MKKFLMACMVAVTMFAGSVFASEAVNINTATVEQLQTLSGIGEKTATEIVAYREAHGAFQSVEDLTHVKGIGEKKLAKISANLTVSDKKE